MLTILCRQKWITWRRVWIQKIWRQSLTRRQTRWHKVFFFFILFHLFKIVRCIHVSIENYQGKCFFFYTLRLWRRETNKHNAPKHSGRRNYKIQQFGVGTEKRKSIIHQVFMKLYPNKIVKIFVYHCAKWRKEKFRYELICFAVQWWHKL